MEIFFDFLFIVILLSCYVAAPFIAVFNYTKMSKYKRNGKTHKRTVFSINNATTILLFIGSAIPFINILVLIYFYACEKHSEDSNIKKWIFGKL